MECFFSIFIYSKHKTQLANHVFLENVRIALIFFFIFSMQLYATVCKIIMYNIMKMFLLSILLSSCVIQCSFSLLLCFEKCLKRNRKLQLLSGTEQSNWYQIFPLNIYSLSMVYIYTLSFLLNYSSSTVCGQAKRSDCCSRSNSNISL